MIASEASVTLPMTASTSNSIVKWKFGAVELAAALEELREARLITPALAVAAAPLLASDPAILSWLMECSDIRL